MEVPEESALLKRLASDDSEAFSQLYKHYAPSIRQFTQKIVKSAELSQDLTQEVFIKVWEYRANLGEIGAFKSYLFTMSKHASLNFLKRAATDSHAKGLLMQHYPPRGEETLDRVLTADYTAYLSRLLAQLTPQSREVFRLCRQEYKTYDEVAELLGISRNTVKKHMVRTLKFLSNSVERDLNITLAVLMAVVFG